MNIVILAGGTGSIALQEGLYNFLDSHLEGIDTKVIVNAYDNGLSTGAVRQVMGGRILGPSDVRKNQTTRLNLENPKSPWLDFLNIRFTVESSEAQSYCFQKINELSSKIGDEDSRAKITPTKLLMEAVEEYFKSPVANKIDYSDFSLANIIYAGFAKANGNSLRKAATIMASLMGIKDNVLLNDDTSMFLGAITKSGRRITDEGDIVSWGNTEDPFVDIFFTDPNGYETKPQFCAEAINAIVAADIVILSSGTQWSSLIPTYASVGFDVAMNLTKAKVLMVMNRVPDKDSPGQTASDIIDILVPKYFKENMLHVIIDPNGDSKMNHLNGREALRVASVNFFDMGWPAQSQATMSRHYAPKVAMAIASTYFQEYLQSDFYMFDYDDTLVGRGNKFPKASRCNISGIMQLNSASNVAICTGNSIKAVNLRSTAHVLDPETFEPVYYPLTVFADGGINKYEYDMKPLDEKSDDGLSTKLVECVNPSVLMPSKDIQDITLALRDAGVPVSKIENRGSAMISIKPIDQEYRPIVLKLVEMIVDKYWDYSVRPAGRTTIEICSSKLSKLDAIYHVFKTEKPYSITYVGDELDEGNDAVVRELADTTSALKCLRVSDPVTTAFFIMTLSAIKRKTPHEKAIGSLHHSRGKGIADGSGYSKSTG